MEQFKHILKLNVIAIITISFLISASSGDAENYGSPVLLMFIDFLFVLGNFVLALYYFIKKENGIGKSFLLCSGLMILIGPATCFLAFINK